MKPEAIIYVEPRDFRSRPMPNITQTIRGNGAEFSISCDFICPSFSHWKETKTIRHPSPPFARIFLMERGTVRIETGSGVRILKKDRIYFLPPEQPFEATYHKGTRIKAFHLYISDGFGFQMAADLKGIPEISDKRMFDAIFAVIGNGEDAVCQASVFQAVVAFCRPLFPELERRAQLSPNQKRVFDIISGSAPGELRVGKLAKQLHTTRAALSKSFERQFKVPLKRYMQDSATHRAKKMLLNPDLTVAEIAFSLGYKDPAYFQRVFKKEVGLTPLSYRIGQKHGG